MINKEEIREDLLLSGASAVGFASAGWVRRNVADSFKKWINEGRHAGMTYLERHMPLRATTDHVLEGAKTIISLAYSYVPEQWRSSDKSVIACYAYGEDYHEVIKKRLKPVVEKLKKKFGGRWRICIDSAPLEERYWALEAGIGKIGLNGSVMVDGCGSLCFLTEILTDLVIDPDTPSHRHCSNCRLCVKSCPSSALLGDGTLDSRKCISFLTIEKKGALEFDKQEQELINKSKMKFLFGCDICQKVCPENRSLPVTKIEEFMAEEKILELMESDILDFNVEKFEKHFKKSAISRVGFEGLRRNALQCLKKND